MDKAVYSIRHCTAETLNWDMVAPLEIKTFFEHSSDHRPVTHVRLLYDDLKLYVRFDVKDRYVRVVAEKYQDSVCKDSCVEFFVQPGPGAGYFNFEVNAGGCMLLYYIPVSSKGLAVMNQGQPVPFELVKEMNVQHSLPARIDPEIEAPCEWTVEYAVPLTVFEYYLGPLGPLTGQIWRGNFFKCADATSHPHWGMWSPITEGDRFHRPDFFGELIFLKGNKSI
jgi:hypothetical protein